MRRLFLTVDYQEFQPETYNGLVVSEGDEEIDRIFTGDFDKDMETVKEKYKNDFMLMSSSVDHFYMDRQNVM